MALPLATDAEAVDLHSFCDHHTAKTHGREGGRCILLGHHARDGARERSFGRSYLSTCDARIVVGLGSAGGSVVAVTVRWPSGKEQIVTDDLTANSIIEITEP